MSQWKCGEKNPLQPSFTVHLISSGTKAFIFNLTGLKLLAMSRLLSLVILLLWTLSSTAQYKNDNVLFTTVDPSDLCSMLEKNKGYLLLDVRSPGEHHDTSTSAGYNLGHLKGARNININELGKRLNEIKEYKDQPVFVYCSHSQRSRRAGKMLADSGFTKVFNINGGMTSIYYMSARENECVAGLVESNNPYNIISAKDLCEKMVIKDKKIYVLDVRSDSAWQHISRDAKENAYGSVKGAVHISLADLPGRLDGISKGQEIVITDIYGDQASAAAILLSKNGFNNVSVLIEGVDRIALTDEQELNCKKTLYKPFVSYQLLNVAEFGRYAATHKDVFIVDARTTDEFGNKHKDGWRNIGHIKNAVNIPASEIADRLAEIEKYKNSEIVIYGFGSGPEIYATANTLQQNGFSKITIITGGLFNLRWTAANRKGQAGLKEWVVDVPEINW